jgi:hypothetical protein
MSKINFKIETKKERFHDKDHDNANADGVKQGDAEA